MSLIALRKFDDRPLHYSQTLVYIAVSFTSGDRLKGVGTKGYTYLHIICKVFAGRACRWVKGSLVRDIRGRT